MHLVTTAVWICKYVQMTDVNLNRQLQEDKEKSFLKFVCLSLWVGSLTHTSLFFLYQIELHFIMTDPCSQT